ncbi:MAG: Trk system potassium transporter TrkA [Clostridiales bacterium]|nr:Trk system potassium transporter TrkA [Clostridiales bacterium]
MKIIIVGCGKVGYTLADTLSGEDHDVTVIDSNQEKLDRLTNELDVAAVVGNGASYRVLQEAGVEDCEVLIAATSQDEVNMLCCLIARKAGRCRTIARVRDPNYYSEIGFIQEELGLSLAINPELNAALACYQLVRAPFAMEIDTFADGKVEMITFDLPDNSPWIGKSLMEITQSSRNPLLIAIVTRKHQAIIPNGSTVIERGDRLSLMLDAQYLRATLESIGVRVRPIHTVFIAGGGNVGYYLARRLCEARLKVTIIEPNRARCDTLNDLLPRVNVIYGDPCSESLLMEEGIDEADAFCSLLGTDSENIMLSLFVSKVSNAKVITRINKMSMSGVINELPLGAIVSPKALTAEHILRYVRAMGNSAGSSNMEAVYRLASDQVEAISFTVENPSAATGRRLMDLHTRSGILVCAVIREGKVTIPSGQDSILPGDQVVIVTTRRGICDLTDVLGRGAGGGGNAARRQK